MAEPHDGSPLPKEFAPGRPPDCPVPLPLGTGNNQSLPVGILPVASTCSVVLSTPMRRKGRARDPCFPSYPQRSPAHLQEPTCTGWTNAQKSTAWEGSNLAIRGNETEKRRKRQRANNPAARRYYLPICTGQICLQ